MNAKELVIKGSEEIVAYVCGKCGLVYSLKAPGAREFAEQCCNPICSCGQPASKGWTVCEACQAKQDREREEANYEKAEKMQLKDYKGEYLYLECFPCEGYVCVEDLDDILADMDPESRPKYAYACTKVGMPHIDIEEALIDHLDDYPEDSGESIDWKRLQDFFDEWAKEQDVEAYFPDNNKVVIL